MSDILIQLLKKLKERQSWCPYCGGEYAHDKKCVLICLWFDGEIDN